MLVRLQSFVLKLCRQFGHCLNINSPTRRPYTWILISGVIGFLLSRYYFQPVFQGVRFLRQSSLLVGPQVNENSTFQEVKQRYYLEQSTDHVKCYPQRRIGKSSDGGWDLCLSDLLLPRAPCLAYSFGIEFDWYYDEMLAKDFGCVVRAFDPSMNLEQHVHQPGPVFFYPYGLAASNTEWNNMFVRHQDNFQKKIKSIWKMKKLETLMAMTQDKNKIIDILKIDIEYSEWQVFEQLLSVGILKKVKILMFETHTNELNDKSTTKKDYLRYLSIIRRIEAIGFRKYKSHFNPLGIGQVRNRRSKNGELSWFQYLNFRETCCYEQFYLNVHYLFS